MIGFGVCFFRQPDEMREPFCAPHLGEEALLRDVAAILHRGISPSPLIISTGCFSQIVEHVKKLSRKKVGYHGCDAPARCDD